MAKQKRSRQTWWQLNALALMMAGLLFLAHRLAPSPGWRTFLEIGVVVGGYGLMALWLETHAKALLDQPSAEADNPGVKSPELEIPPPMSAHIRGQFYDGSDPAIICDEADRQNGHLRLNGHHRARTIPSQPEEAAE